MRIALYSHDTMGLGHLRRNLAIAEALVGSDPDLSVLMIAGARQIGAFALPARTECLALPSLQKGSDGSYASRGLQLPLERLVALRAATIRSALEVFAPDVLIVDKTPRGAQGELGPALEALRETGRTRCVLGLRDILDEPARVLRDWQEARTTEAIERYYDAIWVYGDPRVYDSAAECPVIAPVAHQISYTGYLSRTRAQSAPEESLRALGLAAGPMALCVVGGGQDGAHLAECFVRAELPPNATGVLVPGPFMSETAVRSLHQSASKRARLHVVDFTNRLDQWIRQADWVVAMGGYNTICEILGAQRRALIVPRVHPRREQIIRAQHLQQLGLIDTVEPLHLHAELLGKWYSSEGPAKQRWDLVDLDGLERVPRLLDQLVHGERASAGLVA